MCNTLYNFPPTLHCVHILSFVIKGSWRVLIPSSYSQNTGAEGVGRDRVDGGWTQDLILVVQENVLESKTYKDRANATFSYFKALETFFN